jgi:hypothetical protein
MVYKGLLALAVLLALAGGFVPQSTFAEGIFGPVPVFRKYTPLLGSIPRILYSGNGYSTTTQDAVPSEAQCRSCGRDLYVRVFYSQ